MENTIVKVIVWGPEVELKGLPTSIREEAEQAGAFWVGTGLRMTANQYHKLCEAHPELSFEPYPQGAAVGGEMAV